MQILKSTAGFNDAGKTSATKLRLHASVIQCACCLLTIVTPVPLVKTKSKNFKTFKNRREPKPWPQ